MDRKLLGIFSGTHLTILGLGAMFVPGALYATVATTAVSITDPNTGAKSYVDPGRKLSVFDPIAGYANNPQNYVRLYKTCSAQNGTIYTPTSGKAFIVKYANFIYLYGTANQQRQSYIYANGIIIASEAGTSIANSSNSALGTGFYVKDSESLQFFCDGDGVYYITVTGFLVPASLAPTASAAAVTEQSVRAGPLPHDTGKHL